MKKLLLSSVTLAAMAGSSTAADLQSIKTPPVVGPASLWTGFYAGLNAGGTWGNNGNINTTGIPIYNTPNFSNLFWPGTFRSAAGWTGDLNTARALGFLGGGQVGYNHEITNNIVAGFETDIQGTTSNTDTSPNLYTAVSSSSNSVNLARSVTSTSYTIMQASKSLDYIGTVRGRIGYKVASNLLLYGTGGLAYGGVSLNFNGQQLSNEQTTTFGPGQNTVSKTLVGWAAGGGVEWKLMPNWSLKVEYLYYDLGGFSAVAGNNYRIWNYDGPYRIPNLFNGDLARAVQIRLNHNVNGNITRAGINYHFNLTNIVPIVNNFYSENTNHKPL